MKIISSEPFLGNLNKSCIFGFSDNSSKNIESNSIFNNAIPQTELERMQQLAKLVNSMQLVNEHLQSKQASVMFDENLQT